MYKEILQANPDCALTGSHALILQGFKLKRGPKDIDIYDPNGTFKIIPGMSLPKVEKPEDAEYEDNDAEFERTSYLYEGVNVDVFVPNTKDVYSTIKKDGVRVCHFADIIAAKISYLKSDTKSKYKHLNDVLFFLTANF